jgi:multidrug efflux pump
VISLLLIIFGLVSLQRLSVREYPDIERPVVSITTTYRGASAQVSRTRSRSRSRIASPGSKAFSRSSRAARTSVPASTSSSTSIAISTAQRTTSAIA